MLGFMTDDRAVGLFTSGTKLTHLIIVVLTSLSTAMLPRCSNLISEGKYDDFNAIITKSYHLLMFSAIPLTLGTILLAHPLVYCFCGGEFYGAVPVVLYTAPTIILIGMTQVIGIQILYPYGKENMVIISTLVAAVVNVILNVLLIPSLAETGAAISTLISELSVLVVQVRLGRKYIPFKYLDRQIFTYLFAAFLMSFGIFVSLNLSNVLWQMLIGVIIGTTIYLSVLYLRKDEILIEVLGMVRKFY
jgi:O-antigen/teichoic acid export membrane protein